MSLLDQSGVTGGGLDLYNVHALFINMDNMWTERFENYGCLVLLVIPLAMLGLGSIFPDGHQGDNLTCVKQLFSIEIL